MDGTVQRLIYPIPNIKRLWMTINESMDQRRHARTQMPAFAISSGGTLTDQQIDAIVRGMRKEWLQPGALGGLNPPPTRR